MVSVLVDASPGEKESSQSLCKYKQRGDKRRKNEGTLRKALIRQETDKKRLGNSRHCRFATSVSKVPIFIPVALLPLVFGVGCRQGTIFVAQCQFSISEQGTHKDF